MNDPAPMTGAPPLKQGRLPTFPDEASQRRRFALATGMLVLLFALPFWDLIWFAADSQLYSYILLVPFISYYLVRIKRRTFPAATRPARVAAGVFLAAGLAGLALYWLVLRSTPGLVEDDYLAVMMMAFLLCFYGICGWFWSWKTLCAAAFPLGFLIFMVPIPAGGIQAIDAFLQTGSAAAAAGFFWVTGTPFLQDGLTFQLSDISLHIAPECSGIHSTLVLFITSLLASYLFLRTPWKRAVLTFFVIPLGLVRNGFRVFVLGELCIHVGPHMIDSPIHHKGGPIFFVLALFPLFLLLFLLYKSEQRRGKKKSSPISSSHHE